MSIEERYKVIIAGGRDFNDYDMLERECENLLWLRRPNIEVVSGGARGADFLGEQYANNKGYAVKRFPAEWNKYGNSAGPIRNRQMAKYTDACIVFWDGLSIGTKSMIGLAKEFKLNLIVISYTSKQEIK